MTVAQKPERLGLFIRREPTTDTVVRADAVRNKWDIVAYADEACTTPKGRWPWYITKPKKSHKTAMLDCYRWKLTWLDDLKA